MKRFLVATLVTLSACTGSAFECRYDSAILLFYRQMTRIEEAQEQVDQFNQILNLMNSPADAIRNLEQIQTQTAQLQRSQFKVQQNLSFYFSGARAVVEFANNPSQSTYNFMRLVFDEFAIDLSEARPKELPLMPIKDPGCYANDARGLSPEVRDIIKEHFPKLGTGLFRLQRAPQSQSLNSSLGKTLEARLMLEFSHPKFWAPNNALVRFRTLLNQIQKDPAEFAHIISILSGTRESRFETWASSNPARDMRSALADFKFFANRGLNRQSLAITEFIGALDDLFAFYDDYWGTIPTRAMNRTLSRLFTIRTDADFEAFKQDIALIPEFAPAKEPKNEGNFL